MNRPAYSLLEVLIALAVLILGLAAIIHLTDMAGRNSLESKELAIVQLAAQAKLNELLSVQNTITPTGGEAISGVNNWRLYVELGKASNPGVTAVHIVARKQDKEGRLLSRFELVRWISNDRFPRQEGAP